MKIEIKEKIIAKLKESYNDCMGKFEKQDEFFWYYIIQKEKVTIQYRVYKFITKHENGLYWFTTQKYNIDTDIWDNAEKVSVPIEILDDKSDYWRDPEPIRQSSLQGLRIRLHQTYKITNNIYESFYLVSNEIYHTTLDTVSWFEDEKENKQHEHVLTYNMLKFFQAFEVFKEDIAKEALDIEELLYVSSL